MVVAAAATQNQPSRPAYPSSIEPFSTDTIPIGHSSTRISNGQTSPTDRTIVSNGPRVRPGGTRYQWPRSIASVTLPRNAVPAATRATDSATGSPALIPAATRPIEPMTGATTSNAGGKSPERRRTIDTTSATVAAIAASTAHVSRSGRGSTYTPIAAADAAMTM